MSFATKSFATKHPRGRALVGLTAISVVVALCAPTAASASTPPSTPNLGQQLAVPAYITPGNADWTRIENSGSQLGLVVANVANGPDTAASPQWASVIDATHAKGIKVLGYVDSGYFGFSADHRRTISGETSADAWLAQAEQDINHWYDFYGSSMDGIFIDDVENECGPTAGSNEWVDLYRQLNDYIHTYHSGALTVMNPGVSVPRCYEDSSDVIVTFEGTYASYISPNAAYQTRQWQRDGDPNQFWNIVFDVNTQQELDNVIATSKQNNAGYLYATDDGAVDSNGVVIENPYDSLTSEPLWSHEKSAIAVTDTNTPRVPSRPYTTDVESTTVDLGWTSDWSTERTVGYDLYANGTHIGSVNNYTPGDTDFHVVGLKPGTKYTFTLRGRDRAGNVSALSASRVVKTESSWGAPATAPGSPVATEVSANSAVLSWLPSTDDDAYVTQYEVYRNGIRELTLPDTTTSARVQYLQPGQTYTFTVLARDVTGTPSPASSPVVVTTPVPVPVDNVQAQFTSEGLTISASFNVAFNFHHVYVDDGANHDTGLAIKDIIADHMFENAGFYAHDASQPGGFAWGAVPPHPGSPFLVSTVGSVWTWHCPTSDLAPGATTIRLVVEGAGSSPTFQTAPITVNLT